MKKLNLSLKQYFYAAIYSCILPMTMFAELEIMVNEELLFTSEHATYFLILAILITLPFVPIALWTGLYISNNLIGSMEYIHFIQYGCILIQVILVVHFYNIKKTEAHAYFRKRAHRRKKRQHF